MTSVTSISRRPLVVAELHMDICTLTYGVGDCAATDPVKCYNTFYTCKNQVNYNRGTRIYKIISKNATDADCMLFDARRYLESYSISPTEIKADRTVPARVTINCIDERDFDKGIDPYWSDRGYTKLGDCPGTYWKKFFARNPYYTGRTIIIKRGYPDQDYAEWEVVFTGDIEGRSETSKGVKINGVDKLQKILKTKFPIEADLRLSADLPAVHECKDESEMLDIEGVVGSDFALRKDFEGIKMNPVIFGETGTIPSGTSVFYLVTAYDINDNAIARSALQSEQLPYPATSVTLSWQAVTGASYYKVAGRTSDLSKSATVTSATITDNGGTRFPDNYTVPAEAYRIFKLTGDNPNDVNAWVNYFTVFTVPYEGTDTAKLDVKGYIKVEDELLYYEWDGTAITNVLRAQKGTKSPRHYIGTQLKLSLWLQPDNPFSLLQKIISKTDLPAESIDSDAVVTERNRWSADMKIQFSYGPLVKETSLDNILFDLMTMADAILWINEAGKVTVKHNSEDSIAGSVDDSNNIIKDSAEVDTNEDMRKTRVEILWGRKDVTKSGSDNYRNLHRSINLLAEDPNAHNDSQALSLQTMFINEDIGTVEYINTYLDPFAEELLKRYAFAPPRITLGSDLKDEFKTGSLIYVSTDEFNYLDGTPWVNEVFQIYYKDTGENKIKYKAEHRANLSLNVSHETEMLNQDGTPQTLISGEAWMALEVTGLTIISGEDKKDMGGGVFAISGNIDSNIIIGWNNFYTDETLRYPSKMGTHWEFKYDYNRPNKFVEYYEVMIAYIDTGKEDLVYKYPNIEETNGAWFLNQQVKDIHSEDPDYKYTASIQNLQLGANLYIAVYAVFQKNHFPYPDVIYSPLQFSQHPGLYGKRFISRQPATDFAVTSAGLVRGYGLFNVARESIDPATGNVTIKFGAEMDFLTIRDKMVEISKEVPGVSATGGITVFNPSISIQGISKAGVS